MKKIFTSLFIVAAMFSQAQGVGIGTNLPDNSAILHLNSTTKGLLIPSMTGTQRLQLSSPADGLLVYDLTAQRTFQYQDGTWRMLITNDYWAHSGSRRWVYNGTDSIGIGNAAPNERLHVSGNIRSTGDLKLSGSAGIGMTTAPEQALHVRTTASGEGILLEAVNPILQLRQSNTPAAGYTNKGFLQLAGDDIRIGTNSANDNGRFIIRNNGADRVFVDGAGNMNLTGNLTRSATGDAPLTPLCYGITASISTGGIARGTPNVTVTRTAVGTYIVTCPGLTENSIFIFSPVASGVTMAAIYNGTNQYMVIVRRISDNDEIDQIFKFVVY